MILYNIFYITHVYVRFMINSSTNAAAYMRQGIVSALVQVMACRLYGAKPLPIAMLCYCELDPIGTNVGEIRIRIQSFSSTKIHLKIVVGDVASTLSRGDELTYNSWKFMKS